ncbi:uncharacterized protein LOC123880203 [Maniola jurtina]|uniref:uncharacterized protein LOC123880203 n=1 Tax=Maniola jurtina TaxID=191418 RepID=UPI001E689D5A|nr:uncharacterized protein LOC123880203 [Maniola jurtina]XP_045784151.1 uncharacterized protein LOC123880203 [Maniola jurtina]XP_045784152.1 uncharacterized protein LOC123880203 [Maniola jurtina]
MDRLTLLLFLSCVNARLFCEKTKVPLEMGKWHHRLQHMDSAVVENRPVSIHEGQIYVYENTFPGFIINYIHVDNVAIRSCGASATIKKGGVGTSSVLIVLHAATNEEIRSVVDIWGTKTFERTTRKIFVDENIGNLKSLYLFKELRTVNHNKGY